MSSGTESSGKNLQEESEEAQIAQTAFAANSLNSTAPEDSGQERVKQAMLAPGTLLCDAREKRQLNRAQVGHYLGLTETAVKNLERNRFDAFPNGVYARGYLKNYAKYMDLDVDELVKLYDQYCVENGIDRLHNKAGSEPKSSPKRGVGSKLLWFLVLLLAAAVAYFVFFN